METRPSDAAPMNARDRHLFGPGPKRMLALDGGGVRGALSIGVLEELEARIAEKEGRRVRLCDWFDLIGGTSTGAIIATALALGYWASDIRKFYAELAPKVFKREKLRVIGWQAKFDSRLLVAELDRIIGKRALDSDDLQTGLCIQLKRMDKGSAWTLLNNPHSEFWETPADNSFVGNRHLPLAAVVRASTAAPHFFDPELIEIVKGEPPGLFIDGALTPHNNPCLAMLFAVALPPFRIGWQLDPQHLTIVSVGTGSYRSMLSIEGAKRTGAIGLALHSLAAQVNESQKLTLMLMSWLGHSPVPWVINSEVGDVGAINPPFGHMFNFMRYDAVLEQPWLASEIGLELTAKEVTKLQQLDDARNVERLYEIGKLAAIRQIKLEDL